MARVEMLQSQIPAQEAVAVTVQAPETLVAAAVELADILKSAINSPVGTYSSGRCWGNWRI